MEFQWVDVHAPGLFPVSSTSGGVEHNCSCGLECSSGACCCYFEDSELSCKSNKQTRELEEHTDLLTLAAASEQMSSTWGVASPSIGSISTPAVSAVDATYAPPAELKQCRRCNKLLPRHKFCENARAADGLYTQCRTCVSEKDKQRRSSLKEERRNPVAAKVCSRCQQTKPMQDFYLDHGRADGLQTYCRICYSENYRERRFALLPGEMLEGLWNSEEQQWTLALEKCTQRVEDSGKDGYAVLDSWFFNELPQKIAGMPKEERCIGSEDLVKIIEWKLKRGTWRPKLLDFAKLVPDELVKEASRQAFSLAEIATNSGEEEYSRCCKSALEPLILIKGVGPASASAILTAGFSCFPYFSDEAMDVAVGKKKEYTVKRYIEYALAMRKKALHLSSEDHVWTEKDIERALQSEALQYNSTATANHKRKRAEC